MMGEMRDAAEWAAPGGAGAHQFAEKSNVVSFSGTERRAQRQQQQQQQHGHTTQFIGPLLEARARLPV
jgi:hypothetical protein